MIGTVQMIGTVKMIGTVQMLRFDPQCTCRVRG